MLVVLACSGRRSRITIVVGRLGRRGPQLGDRLARLGQFGSDRQIVVREPPALVVGPLGRVDRGATSSTSAGTPEAVNGRASVVAERRNRPMVVWWMNSWCSVIRSVVGRSSGGVGARVRTRRRPRAACRSRRLTLQPVSVTPSIASAADRPFAAKSSVALEIFKRRRLAVGVDGGGLDLGQQEVADREQRRPPGAAVGKARVGQDFEPDRRDSRQVGLDLDLVDVVVRLVAAWPAPSRRAERSAWRASARPACVGLRIDPVGRA